MAWTNPPTFSDGAPASASNLNILSNDIEYLKGIVDAPNMPSPTIEASSDTTKNIGMRHRHNYLHWWFDITGGVTSDTVRIRIYDSAGTLIATPLNETGNYTDGNEPSNYQSSYDISALTVLQFYRYEIYIAIDGAGGGDPIYMFYLEERTTA